MRTFTRLPAVLLLALTAGCVSTGKYDAAVADGQRKQTELETTRAELEKTRAESTHQLGVKQAELDRLHQMMGQAESRCEQIAHELEASTTGALGCSQALDAATALNQQLRKELEKQGKNVDQLLSAKGALATSLDQARARLDELRRAQAAAEARAALFRDLALRFKSMLDSGDLAILVRSGRMVLVLPTDILFDSGKVAINPRGKESLVSIAGVLVTLPGRRFQVAGHTDDQPIRHSKFASNWELSGQRALEVVSFLIQNGMAPESLSAAAYGEFDGVVANDSPEHQAQNRRIEITLQPNIDELVMLPGAG